MLGLQVDDNGNITAGLDNIVGKIAEEQKVISGLSREVKDKEIDLKNKRAQAYGTTRSEHHKEIAENTKKK